MQYYEGYQFSRRCGEDASDESVKAVQPDLLTLQDIDGRVIQKNKADDSAVPAADHFYTAEIQKRFDGLVILRSEDLVFYGIEGI